MTAEKSCNTRPATCAQRVSAAKAGADCPERDPSGIPQIFSGFFRCCHIFGVPIGEEEEERWWGREEVRQARGGKAPGRPIATIDPVISLDVKSGSGM